MRPSSFARHASRRSLMDFKHIAQIALVAAVTVAIAMRVDAIRSVVAPGTGTAPKA